MQISVPATTAEHARRPNTCETVAYTGHKSCRPQRSRPPPNLRTPPRSPHEKPPIYTTNPADLRSKPCKFPFQLRPQNMLADRIRAKRYRTPGTKAAARSAAGHSNFHSTYDRRTCSQTGYVRSDTAHRAQKLPPAAQQGIRISIPPTTAEHARRPDTCEAIAYTGLKSCHPHRSRPPPNLRTSPTVTP